MKVICSVINWSQDVLTELNLKSIILEVDQAIYTKILDVMFRIEHDGSIIFDKIIPRIGGFHIAICMLKAIFIRFNDLFIYLIIVCT